jgi:hypothetical protein
MSDINDTPTDRELLLKLMGSNAIIMATIGEHHFSDRDKEDLKEVSAALAEISSNELIKITDKKDVPSCPFCGCESYTRTFTDGTLVKISCHDCPSTFYDDEPVRPLLDMWKARHGQ